MDRSIRLTSSAALKDGDSSCGLAAVPRFEVENDQVVGFVIADMFDSVSSEGRKRRFVSGMTGFSAPRFR